MRVGTLIQYRLRLHGVPITWPTSIQEWDPPHRFVDVQVRGPYALWHHTHEFEPLGECGTLMRDTVRYAIGFGPLGELARRRSWSATWRRIFDFRAAEVARRIERAPSPAVTPVAQPRRPGAASIRRGTNSQPPLRWSSPSLDRV